MAWRLSFTGGNAVWAPVCTAGDSLVWEDCPGLGHEPGIQCRFLCLLSNSYIVCWVSSCLEIQDGGLSTFSGQATNLTSEEDNAVDAQLLSPLWFSHKWSSWCQLELNWFQLYPGLKEKVQGVEMLRHLSMSSYYAEAPVCYQIKHWFALVMLLCPFFWL